MVETSGDELTDEEALMKIVGAMKDNPITQEEKLSIYNFLNNIIVAADTTKIGNLKDDKDFNELGIPEYSVRGCKELALISKEIMDNDFFTGYFEKEAENTLATSLSRNGFIIRQGTTQTKQVADITKRRKVNKGLFKRTEEEQGGDTTS